jgi:MoaD family protein
MPVTVHYFAQIRRAAGCASEQVDVEPGITLGGLLLQLADRHGAEFRRLLLDEAGGLQKSVLVFVGQHPADGVTVLQDGDEVTILTPMSGGGDIP